MVATIKLNKTQTTIYVGESETLQMKGTSKKVSWFSSNKKIAKVNKKGKVNALWSIWTLRLCFQLPLTRNKGQA